MRKNELDILSKSYARAASRANTDTSTEELTARAKNSLEAVGDVYSTAAAATDSIRMLLSQASDLSPKELLQLTSALKNVSGVLAEAREEARRTVSDLSTQQQLDLPVPSDARHVASLHDSMTNFSQPDKSVVHLPTSDELLEENLQEDKRKL